LLEVAVELPEAALARAEILMATDGNAHRREIEALLSRFVDGASERWNDKRQYARYFNLVARLAQIDLNPGLLEKALRTSLDYWPASENPASHVLDQVQSLKGTN
jgi:hypothetical protein